MAECHNVTSVTVDNAKSEGQCVLERLRDVHRDLTAIALDLAAVKHSIGLSPASPNEARAKLSSRPPAGRVEPLEHPRPITQFFPALHRLADELEVTTRELADSITGLARGF